MLYFRVPFNVPAPTSSCCRPTSRRWSPCSWVVLLRTRSTSSTGSTVSRRASSPSPAARCSSTPTGCSRPASSRARTSAPLVAIIAVGVCVGLPAAQLQPGADHHGRRRRDVPRAAARGDDDHGRRPHRHPFSGNTYFFFAPLLIPLVILGVPIVDTAFSFVRRLVKRQHWHQADAGHLHHRLMRLGHGPRRAVVILWAWTALLSGVALLPDVHERGNALVPFAARRRSRSLPATPGSTPACPVRAGSAARQRARAPDRPSSRPDGASRRRRPGCERRRDGALADWPAISARGRSAARFDSACERSHRLRIDSQAASGRDGGRSGVIQRGLRRWFRQGNVRDQRGDATTGFGERTRAAVEIVVDAAAVRAARPAGSTAASEPARCFTIVFGAARLVGLAVRAYYAYMAADGRRRGGEAVDAAAASSPPSSAKSRSTS